MTKLTRLLCALARTSFASSFVAASLVAGCAADASSDEAATDTAAEDLQGQTAVDRAMEWVDAKLHYCQAPYHGHDDDPACRRTCERDSNKEWNPYRSDCSGLISWAWKMPPPGRTTFEFAPHDNAVSHTIPARNLEPGDAVNIWQDHIMLFKRWVVKDRHAVFIEEPGCSSDPPHAHEFTSEVRVDGDKIWVKEKHATFVAIRRK